MKKSTVTLQLLNLDFRMKFLTEREMEILCLIFGIEKLFLRKYISNNIKSKDNDDDNISSKDYVNIY